MLFFSFNDNNNNNTNLCIKYLVIKHNEAFSHVFQFWYKYINFFWGKFNLEWILTKYEVVIHFCSLLTVFFSVLARSHLFRYLKEWILQLKPANKTLNIDEAWSSTLPWEDICIKKEGYIYIFQSDEFHFCKCSTSQIAFKKTLKGLLSAILFSFIFF